MSSAACTSARRRNRGLVRSAFTYMSKFLVLVPASLRIWIKAEETRN
jgi:hypothetical protein